MKRLDQPPSTQLLSSRTAPPGLGAGKGYSQKGMYQEKLPEQLQVRTKTMLFRRCARLKKKTHIITLLSKETIFPYSNPTRLRKKWFCIYPLNKSHWFKKILDLRRFFLLIETNCMTLLTGWRFKSRKPAMLLLEIKILNVVRPSLYPSSGHYLLLI